MEEVKPKTEEVKEQAKDLFDHATDYLETFYQLAVINVVQKGVNIASGIINGVIICFLGLFVLLFAGMGVAWWLGNVINSRAGGFFIVAGVCLVSIFVIIAMRKKTIFPLLRNIITRKIYE
jgi:hypothetical protein